MINFRNYQYEKIDFEEDLNLITGQNGQGKTNLVEAISMLSVGKSFRTSREKEMIFFDKDSFILRAFIESFGRDYKIEIKIGNEVKKAVRINSSPIERLTELLGIFNVVVFAPEDLKLVKEGPKERRLFMDREISQIRPLYYNHIYSYRKALIQRNNLLKNSFVDENLLDVYDEQMASIACNIMGIRKDFINKISPFVSKNHSEISSRKENLQIFYEPNIDTSFQIAKREELLRAFRNSRKEDLRKKTTSIGPHKDDIKILINGVDIRSYGSQGQKRSAAISIKLSEIELIYEEKGEYPVVLLDDIFSELDGDRQQMLVSSFEKIQTFITTANMDNGVFLPRNRMKIYHVENGSIGIKNRL